MKKQPAELPFLLREIEQVIGIDGSCIDSFDELCDLVIEKVEDLPVPKNCPRHSISKKTLRRTWGKLRDGYGTSSHTLHLLARIAGYRGWTDFCNKLVEKLRDGNPLHVQLIDNAALTVGATYLFGQYPDRYLYAEYLGNDTFKAGISRNFRLPEGSIFKAPQIYLHPRLDFTPNPSPASENEWWTPDNDNDNA